MTIGDVLAHVWVAILGFTIGYLVATNRPAPVKPDAAPPPAIKPAIPVAPSLPRPIALSPADAYRKEGILYLKSYAEASKKTAQEIRRGLLPGHGEALARLVMLRSPEQRAWGDMLNEALKPYVAANGVWTDPMKAADVFDAFGDALDLPSPP